MGVLSSLCTVALAAFTLSTSASVISQNDTIVERQSRNDFGLGGLNVVSGPNPFLQLAANGGTYTYFLTQNRCVMEIWFQYPNEQAVIQGAVGGRIADCTPPNYGRMIFQDIGNFYIVRNDDPNQVLYQSGTSVAANDAARLSVNTYVRGPWVSIYNSGGTEIFTAPPRQPPPGPPQCFPFCP